jgi:hypothetical protein
VFTEPKISKMSQAVAAEGKDLQQNTQRLVKLKSVIHTGI